MKKKTLHHILDYTGKCQKKQDTFEFEMNDSTKIKSINYLKAYNPTFDNMFKKVFKNDYILLSFLNDILFPNENKIKKIQILNINFNGPNGKYSYGSINLDMFCACFFDEEISTDNNSNEDMDIDIDSNKMAPLKKKYKLVVDIEMQRIIKESPSERFLKYMSYIEAGILNENILIIVLLIKTSEKEKENKFSNINYVKKSIPKYKTLTEYENRKVIEIDLNYCYNLMKDKKELWIVDPDKILTKKGKEWIKLLTMQIWCERVDTEAYAFPNLEDIYFFQPKVKDSLRILNVEEPFYNLMILRENEEMNKMAQIEKLEKDNKTKDKKIQDKEKQIQDKNKTIQDKDKLIQEKDKLLQEKDKFVEEKKKQMQEKNNLIKVISEQNKKYAEKLLSLGVSIDDLDKSRDDSEYYDNENDDSDESYKPEDEEDEMDMD